MVRGRRTGVFAAVKFGCPLLRRVDFGGCNTMSAEDAVWSPTTGPFGSTSGCGLESLFLEGLLGTLICVGATPSENIFTTPKFNSGALGECELNTGSVVKASTDCALSVEGT